MITTATLHGGALYRTAGGTLAVSRATPRVITCNPGAGLTITLPDPADYGVHERGGPYYLIYRLGGSSVTVQTHTGSTIGTPGVGVAVLLSLGANGWVPMLRTVNSAKTAGIGAHDTPAALITPSTEEPFCFRGDECDYAESLGNVPLDGRDGRPLAIAPMFQNPVLHAKNAAREAIRAADFVMPKVILIGFLRDQFVQDPNHPLSATYTLSQVFFDKLYFGDRKHGLVYVGTASGKSRHWHHARFAGANLGAAAWGMPSGGVDVIRHYWRKEIEYTPEGTTTPRTMDIRFCMEHSVNPEPTITPDGTGGKNDEDDGHWGARFGLAVFTNEVDPSFSDGGSYTPIGAGAPVTFTRNDPAAWGGAVSMGTDDKFVHPQAVIYGSIVTTFEAPFGSEHVPPLDRETVSGLRGRNRSFCYRWSNAAPWLTGGCTDPAPMGAAAFRNCTFGWSTGSISSAGITWGGDVPKSKPHELILLENGGGVGRTLLQPLRTGWDESCGKLDLENGTAVSIKFCSDDQYGVLDDLGRKRWPVFEVPACTGHPDEPFEGIGGTHSCFNTARTPVPCCVTLTAGTMTIHDVCTMTITVYDSAEPGDTSCPVKSQECKQAASYTTTITMELEDYDYNANGDQDLRTIAWAGYRQDPDYVPFDYVYDNTSTDLTQLVGSWSFGSTVDVTAAGSGPDVDSVLTYTPSGSTWEDMRVKARILKAKLGVHGVGVCVAGGPQSGYFALLRHSSGNNATLEIRKRASGTYSLLASIALTNLTSDTAQITFTKWGTRLTAVCTPNGQTATELEIDDCSIENGGNPAWVVESGSTGQFDQLEVEDRNIVYVDCLASLSKCTISAVASDKASNGYGKCTQSGPTGCGTHPYCGCTHIAWGQYFDHATSWTGAGVCADIPENEGTVTWAGGPMPNTECDDLSWCDSSDPKPRCGDCPGPFMTLSFRTGGTCRPAEWDEIEDTPYPAPKMCGGIDNWRISVINCA